MESLEQWMLHNFEPQDIVSIAQDGADQGWPLISTMKETSALYERFHEEIWDLVINKYKSLHKFTKNDLMTNAWVFEACMVMEALEIVAHRIASEDI